MGQTVLLVLDYRFLCRFHAALRLGFLGMTRRLSQQIDPEFHTLLVVAAGGVVFTALGILCQVIQIVLSIIQRDQNRDLTGDPWGGRNLEWSISSPPPFYNFALVPDVNNHRDAFWQMKEDGTAYQQSLAYEPVHMPKNTGAGVIIAAFSLVFGFAMIWHIWWLAIIGFAGMIVTWIVHSFNEDVDYYVPVSEVERIENRHYEQIKETGLDNINIGTFK
jgi:cytochrome o ubiquinol oxidase subunit 1